MQRYISLKYRVLFFLVVGLALPLTVMGYYFNETQKNQLKSKANEDQDRIAQILALSSSKPLWDLSQEALKPIANSALQNEEIFQIKIFDNKNAIFLEAQDKTQPQDVHKTLTIEKPITYDKNVIGKIELRYSLEDIEKQQAQNQLVLILFFILQGFICGLILFYFISVQVLNPITKLKQQAQKIAIKLLNEPFLWSKTDEIGELGIAIDFTRVSLRSMFVELERKNADLSNLNRNLEKKVVDRTAAIRTILDHVKFGFLLIDQQLIIQNGYTKSCEELFGEATLEGKALTQALKLQGDQLDAVSFSLAEVFEDSFIPADIAIDQLPKKFVVDSSILSMEGSPIRDKAGKVERILFTFIDITKFDQIERENRFNRALVRILHDIRAFQRFIAEANGRILEARAAVKAGDDATVRREVHTLKGNSAAFGMEDLVGLIHFIEESPQISESQISSLQEYFEGFLQDNFELLKISFDQPEQDAALYISKDDLHQLHIQAQSSTNPEELKAFIDQWIQNSSKISIAEILGPVQSYVERLAKDLDRKVDFKITGSSLRLNSEPLKDVLQNLIHLLRNAMDHGIEPEEERGTKPPVGSVSLDFKQDGPELIITVMDDGRGIDLYKLADKAIEKGILNQEQIQSLNQSEIIELIFHHGFSTSSGVNEVSGRGVGMSAVKEAVEGAGGRISVATTPGQGTQVKIRVPLEVKAKLS